MAKRVQDPKQDFIEKKWKWHDIWPSMVTHTQNSCSAFKPSKVHTHSSEHTHTHTHTHSEHPERAAAPWEQLRVQCLAQGHLNRGIDGGESKENYTVLLRKPWLIFENHFLMICNGIWDLFVMVLELSVMFYCFSQLGCLIVFI